MQTVLPTDFLPVKDAIQTVNVIIKSHEKTGHYQVIDLYSEFAGLNGLIRPELTNDGTHLTQAGYNLWVELIKDYIK